MNFFTVVVVDVASGGDEGGRSGCCQPCELTYGEPQDYRGNGLVTRVTAAAPTTVGSFAKAQLL
jgi:hypothetical protein